MQQARVHIAVLSVAGPTADTGVEMESVVADAATKAGHQITAFEAVRNTEVAIRSQLIGWVEDPDVDVVLILGEGENTNRAMQPLVEQPLPGFADQLRMIAYQEVGASAMLGSPQAARCGNTFVFVLPAGDKPVRAAMDKLILPQLDSRTKPQNLVSAMPRLSDVTKVDVTKVDVAPAPKDVKHDDVTKVDNVPAEIRAEQTAKGAHPFARLPAASAPVVMGTPREVPENQQPRAHSKTGKHVIARKVEDPTKPIDLDKLEQQLEMSKTPEDVTTSTPASRPIEPSQHPVFTDVTKRFPVQTPPMGAPLPAKLQAATTKPRPLQPIGDATKPMDLGKLPKLPPGATGDTDDDSPILAPPPAATSRPQKPLGWPSAVAPPNQPMARSAAPVLRTQQSAVVPAPAQTVTRPMTPPPAAPLPSIAKVEPEPAPPAVEERAPAFDERATTEVEPAAVARIQLKPAPGPLVVEERVRQTPVPAEIRAEASPPPTAAPKPAREPAPAAETKPASATETKPASAAETKPASVPTRDAALAPARDAAPEPARDAAPEPAREPSRDSIDSIETIDSIEEIVDEPAAAASAAAASPRSAPPTPAPRPRPPTPAPPTAPPMPVVARETMQAAAAPMPARPHMIDVAELVTRAPSAGDSLPQGQFTYPTLKPKRWPLAIAGLLGGAGIAIAVIFFMNRDDSDASSKPVEVATPAIDAAAPAIEIDAAVAAVEPEPEIEPTPEPEPEVEPTPEPEPEPPVAAVKPTNRPTNRPTTNRPTTTKPTTATKVKEPEPEKPPTVAAHDVTRGDGCDEVSCVMDKYARACCAKYKPQGDSFKPTTTTAGGTPESLDKPQIKAGVDRVRPRVMACGDKFAAKGTVKLAISVDAGGSVTELSVTATPDDGLGDCVADVLRKAKFVKTVNGGSFTYPFVF